MLSQKTPTQKTTDTKTIFFFKAKMAQILFLGSISDKNEENVIFKQETYSLKTLVLNIQTNTMWVPASHVHVC